jgi:hypothetical protein
MYVCPDSPWCMLLMCPSHRAPLLGSVCMQGGRGSASSVAADSPEIAALLALAEVTHPPALDEVLDAGWAGAPGLAGEGLWGHNSPHRLWHCRVSSPGVNPMDELFADHVLWDRA